MEEWGVGTPELERIDRRIDDAFGAVYPEIEAPATRLRAALDRDGRRALAQLEAAYLRALAVAARSGLHGGRPTPPGVR